MNEQSNVPMASGGPTSIFQTWISALTKPNEQTYAQIAASPNAKTSTALLWVFVGSLIQFFAAFLVQSARMSQMMQGSGLEDRPGAGLIAVICGAPIVAIVSVIFFAAFTGVVQWVAGMFGGRGSFEKLVYVLAAITVPFTFISAVLTLLGAIPFVGACFGIVSLIAGIYALVLEVMAVKGVNQFGWGQAAGSLLLPGAVLFCCLSVVFFGMLSVFGAALREAFNQINQSLAP